MTRIISKTDVSFTPLLTAHFITASVMMMNGKGDEMPLIRFVVQLEVVNASLAQRSFVK